MAADYSDDFSGYANQAAADAAWASSDTSKDRVNITNKNLAFAFKRHTAVRIAHDLGAGNVSDTKWVLRFRMQITAQTANNKEFDIGLFDSDQTVASNSGNQDCIVCSFEVSGSAPGTLHDFRAGAGDGVTEESQTQASRINVGASNWATNTDYFVELKRTSTTQMRVSLSSTSSYSGDLGTQTLTIPSTIVSLRYIKIADYGSFSAVSDTGTAIIDDLQFWNGANAPPSVSPKTFTTDLLVQAIGNTKTFATDLLVKAIGNTKTFALDLYSQIKGNTKTFTLDLYTQIKGQTKTFTLDLLTKAIGNTKTFALDLYTQVKGLTKTFTMDMYVDITYAPSFKLDLLVKVLGLTKTFKIDLIIPSLKTFLLDTIVVSKPYLSPVIDLIVKASNSFTTQLDLFISKAGSKTFSLDSMIQAQGVSVNTNLDVMVSQKGNILTSLLDLFVKKAQSMTSKLGVRVTNKYTKTFALDLIVPENHAVRDILRARQQIKDTLRAKPKVKDTLETRQNIRDTLRSH